MRRKAVGVLLAGLAFVLLSSPAGATCPALPYTLTNGQTADAAQVMADLNALLTCINTGAGTPAGSTNAIQYNAGSGSFGGVGPLTNGQLVIGSTGNAPQAATLTGRVRYCGHECSREHHGRHHRPQSGERPV